RQIETRGKRTDLLCLERFHESLVSSRNLSEEGCGLLPFPFRINVTVVAAPETKHVQQVAGRFVVFHARQPRGIVSRRQLLKRGRAKLRMFAEESHDLQSVDVADHTQASAPGVAVAVRRKQIPPGAHLRLQGRL